MNLPGRSLALYYSWSRPEETSARLEVIENRFPSLFESRRMLYPQLQELADATSIDQGIGGFLDHMSAATRNCPETATKLPAGGHENCPLAAMGSARHDVVCLAAVRG